MSEESKQESEPESYVIERDGKRDLTFRGREIASVSTQEWSGPGPGQNRWDIYTLYRTDGGKYVLAHEYVTQWEGERGSNEAWIADTDNEALECARFRDSDGEGILPDAVKKLARNAGIDLTEHID